MKKLGIDIDGVLADFTSEMINILRSKIGISLPLDYQPSDWDWTSANLPADAMSKAWKIIKDTPNFWHNLEPLKDNMAAMTEFFYENQGQRDIYFITSRVDTIGSTARYQSEKWLQDYLGNPKDSIHVLTVDSSANKIDIIRALGISYFIDDYFPTVVAASKVKGVDAVLHTQSWNSKEHCSGLKRVDNLYEFFKRVEQD